MPLYGTRAALKVMYVLCSTQKATDQTEDQDGEGFPNYERGQGERI